MPIRSGMMPAGHEGLTAAGPAPLRVRSPAWGWRLLHLVIAMLPASTVVFIASLLAIRSHNASIPLRRVGKRPHLVDRALGML